MNHMSVFEKSPDPIFARKEISLLDGEWEISIGGEPYRSIRVPYCPESELSGVGHTDFIPECVYRKKFVAPVLGNEKRLWLHFGAVDYFAEVLINGKSVGTHAGGYTPFCFDITPVLCDGENEIEVRVKDDMTKKLASGKQSSRRESYGCFYTRTTGLWQSVWLETRPQQYIRYARITPSVSEGAAYFEVGTIGKGEFSAQVEYGGKVVGTCEGTCDERGYFVAKLSEKHLWEVGKGRLYTVCMRFGEDEVYTYFGLREVKYDGMRFLLNGKSVFQRLVLEQGYYPKGVYTPETEKDFRNDILRAIALGFNGARLHQKVFAPKYLYECDKLGFLVWGEYASWGMDYTDLTRFGAFANEWREAVERDFNHPSIITWCPLNEVWGKRDKRFIDGVYSFTKALDSSRPCVDVSGGVHGSKTDLFDFHTYAKFDGVKKLVDRAMQGEILCGNMFAEGEGTAYHGEPLNVSEYGGVAYTAAQTNGQGTEAWGYTSESDEEKFISAYEELAEYLLSCERLSGFCYTQLYDVEQEQNGLFTYDRRPKFSAESMERIRLATSAKAAIEKEGAKK